MKNVSFLFPFKTDHGQRERIFNWVQEFYKKYMPEAELCVGEGTCQESLFSRSIAINNAAKKATGDVFVIADTDLIFDPKSIIQSVDLIKQGAAWVIPYYRFHYLSKNSTNLMLNSTPEWPITMEIDAHTPNKMKNIGLNILPRKNFEMVNGFDERFCGWGGEDGAFIAAVNTLCGQYKRLDADVYHLWHSHNGLSGSGNPFYAANKMLHSRYRNARKSKEAMRSIIDERNDHSF